ncbi:MAG: hypothetical protein SGILL_009493, partial [Bacillariaceae sp.]
MLEDADKNHQSDIVSWLPGGTSFIVHNVPEFVNHILPKYFKQTKYKSFQRQLNLWCFERLTQGPDKGAYFHPQFSQENPEKLCKMTRQRSKKTGPGGSSPSPASSSSSTAKIAIKKMSKKSASGSRRSGPSAKAAAAAAANDASLSFANPFMMPRQVSESSLESFGELFRELDTSAGDCSTLDLAEFEGFTFHLLEQERYEELNMEFKFTENAGNTPSQDSASRRASAVEEDCSNVHSLLQELEQGTFG